MVKELSPGDQDFSRWKVIYPLYLNINSTRSGGRLASSINCVECPTVAEMAEVCIQLGIPCKIESKRHPKDYRSLGRIRFKLFESTGKAFNDKILTKKALLKQIGSMIPKLKSRQNTTSFVKEQSNLKSCKAKIDETLTENNSGIKEAARSVSSCSANAYSNGTKCYSKKKK